MQFLPMLPFLHFLWLIGLLTRAYIHTLRLYIQEINILYVNYSFSQTLYFNNPIIHILCNCLYISTFWVAY